MWQTRQCAIITVLLCWTTPYCMPLTNKKFLFFLSFQTRVHGVGAVHRPSHSLLSELTVNSHSVLRLIHFSQCRWCSWWLMHVRFEFNCQQTLITIRTNFVVTRLRLGNASTMPCSGHFTALPSVTSQSAGWRFWLGSKIVKVMTLNAWFRLQAK